MKRVLITGGGGQLATALAEEADNIQGVECILRSRNELDITDTQQVSRELQERYDYCINTAAFTAVDDAESNSELAHMINSSAVRQLAKICKNCKTTLIHISTDYVFDGGKTGGRYTPNDLPNPINEYGKSKLMGERAIQEVGGKYFILRTSWLYNDRHDNFYTKIVALAKAGKTLKVTTEEVGVPTHTRELAKFIWTIIAESRENYGIYHVTGGYPMSRFEFARRILEENELLEEGVLLPVTEYKAAAKRPKRVILISK